MSWDSGLVSLTNHVQLIAKPFLISTFLFGNCSSAVKTNYCSGRLFFPLLFTNFPPFPKKPRCYKNERTIQYSQSQTPVLLTRKNIQATDSIFLFRRTKFDFLVVTVASIWSRETYSLHRLNAKFFHNNCEKERTVNVLFKVNSRKFSYFSKVNSRAKKELPQSLQRVSKCLNTAY